MARRAAAARPAEVAATNAEVAARNAEVAATNAEITLQNVGSYRWLDAPGLRDWSAALVGSLAPRASSFGVRLVGDRAMMELQRRFRGRETTTDVLSCPGDGGGTGHLGDVVVCVAAARRQAPEGNVEAEIRRLLLHGALHCFGYDHETDDGEMTRLERRLRRRWVGS